ncbi:hypothetical protein IO99_06140 [Clostridium sulfidigenes]|uniref:Uncharacterized protein n=1 Tax=Clostridium sulfidigenes TaxID=318464 RepID=A0A084JDY4_9CLOT|nr:hypothetical protein [Clostridium sulfidigenes]KEZ87168.1 hypothetical protein IO99_06140 [Clostridium sulfidigenes]
MKKDKIKYENIIIGIILFSIIAAFAFLPIILSYIQQNYLIGKVETTIINSDNSINSSETSIVDKLSMICGYGKMNKDIILIDKKQLFQPKMNNISLPDSIINEIKKLQDIDIIPKVNLDNNLRIIDFTLKTYIDSKNLENKVKVWDISLSTDECALNIVIDIETNIIYGFSISSFMNNSDIKLVTNPNEFASYLGIKWSKVEDYGYSNGTTYSIVEKQIFYIYSVSDSYIGFNIINY